MNTTRPIALAFLLALSPALPACSKNSSADQSVAATAAEAATITVEPAAYSTAFATARDVIRDLGFMLDRVDAQAGVITTQPKGTAGLATPWDREQTSIGQEVEDALQHNRRVVRVDAVRVAPDGTALTTAGVQAVHGSVAVADTGADRTNAEIDDLRASTTPVQIRISVELSRMHLSGRRINTLSITDSTYTHDPNLDARNMAAYSVVYAQDPELAAKIADRIRTRLAPSAARAGN